MPEIIQSNKAVMGGLPVIRDTRVPVSRVVSLIAQNYDLDDIKKELPQLTKLTKKDLADILAYYHQRFNSL